MIWFEFYRYVPISQVIGRTREVKRRAVLRTDGNAQQSLRRSFYFNQTAIISHQHIATAHHMTALQKH